MYVQDTWRASKKLTLDLGLHYELYTPFSERARRDAGVYEVAAGTQEYLINPDPVFRTNMNNWGPRFGAHYSIDQRTRAHIGGTLTTIPPNLTQTNYSTGGLPTVLTPRVTAAPSSQISYGYQITPEDVPPLYSPAGVKIYGTYPVRDVPPNTPIDIARLERELAKSGNTQTAPLKWVGSTAASAMRGWGHGRPHWNGPSPTSP